MTRLTADILTLMAETIADVTFSRASRRADGTAVAKRKTTTTKTTA
ncbi:hypothetical protein [Roseibium sp. RKSG952]|nr:hypothetical protein [Roseibium sp. RKSG952]